MAINMSYCRLENTYLALKECINTNKLDDDSDLSEEEYEYRERLIELCTRIAYDYGNIKE